MADESEDVRMELARRVADKVDTIAGTQADQGAALLGIGKTQEEMKAIQSVDHDALIAMKGTLEILSSTGQTTSDGINVLTLLAKKADDREEKEVERQEKASTNRWRAVSEHKWLIAVIFAAIFAPQLVPQLVSMAFPGVVAPVAVEVEPAP